MKEGSSISNQMFELFARGLGFWAVCKLGFAHGPCLLKLYHIISPRSILFIKALVFHPVPKAQTSPEVLKSRFFGPTALNKIFLHATHATL